MLEKAALDSVLTDTNKKQLMSEEKQILEANIPIETYEYEAEYEYWSNCIK